MVKRLRRAGLQLLPGGVPAVTTPPSVMSLLTTCGNEDRRRDAAVDGEAWADGWLEENPDFVPRANAVWHALAVEHQLFGPEGDFLLLVGRHWRRVHLLDEWDLIGAGSASRLLGSATAGCPEFAMTSLDGRVALRGTTYQSCISSLVVPVPWLAPTVRAYMGRLGDRVARGLDTDPENVATVRAWERYVRHQRAMEDAYVARPAGSVACVTVAGAPHPGAHGGGRAAGR
ncbi:hypothetical protein AB0F13_20330 [Streptomyces sp. NPDC026206]|uniref:hypothetical protein n=1 Tax=Streptomyces sp. NPDC026206 TaxID=3157089 RepID=UPI0033D1DFB2